MSNPYDNLMPPGPFGRAVDEAIAAENAEFLANAAAQERTAADADRQARIMEAQRLVGDDAIVVHTALARDIVRLLHGQAPAGPFSRDSLIASFAMRVGEEVTP